MDAGLITDLEGPAPVLAHLLTVTLPDATLRLTLEGGFVVWDGDTYSASDPDYGVLARVSEIEDGITGSATPCDITLQCPNAAIADLIAPEVQGGAVTLHLATVDRETGLITGEPELLFRGELDQPSISVGASQGLDYSCITEEARMLEPNEEQRLTDSFHKSVWPGELGFEHVTDVERKVYWRADDPNNAIS